MANIFLTKKCNLSCSYCFADEFVNKSNEEFSFENFKKTVEFIKTDKNERIGLIGGEPTLYSHFREVLLFLNNDSSIKSYIIFTNGLEIDKYIDYINNKKAQILINCNSPIDIGIQYQKLKNNIELLNKKGIKNYGLGINLYSPELEYSYIFDLLKITNMHSLRFSLSLPNSDKEKTENVLEAFLEFKPYLMKFFEDCYTHEIVPYNDCNAIPSCLLTREDKKLLLQFKRISDRYKIMNTILSNGTCLPVIDIFPDMTAARCFGLAKCLRVPILDFGNFHNLKMYFFNKIDLYSRLSFVKKDCEDCASRLYDKCGLCYTYKLKQCKKLKNIIMENMIM